MSKTGRRIIDGIKRSTLGGYLRLPAPPHGSPLYYSNMYRNFQPSTVLEWGNLTLEHHLLQYDYKGDDQETMISTTFAETIGVDPAESAETAPILILGCGYSRLGEDMHAHGWKHITQVDTVSKAISDLSERCASGIECIDDDARTLSAFTDETMAAVVDKGLLDSLVLSDEQLQMQEIMTSVHRVLQPDGTFLIFSLSEPISLVPHLVASSPCWQPSHVQVQELETTFLYRCQKVPIPKQASPRIKRKNKKRGR